jgi:EAL domain-containing protein (putative c-di-GMP-specific phosphodiesterase class I)
LTYLRKLPIDEVKVDYDLIGHPLTDPRAEAIMRAVIDLSHTLNLTIVAEGVENARTAEWLRDRDVKSGKASITARRSRPPR